MPEELQFARTFLDTARQNLRDSRDRILHCLDQLDDSLVWWRPFAEANSIANILLHLCGNLGQWIVSPLTGAPDSRDREKEFADRGPIPLSELKARLIHSVDQADAAMCELNPALLLETRDIQGTRTTLLGALMNSLSHFRGHEQEITYITRLKLENAFRFRADPATLNHPER